MTNEHETPAGEPTPISNAETPTASTAAHPSYPVSKTVPAVPITEWIITFFLMAIPLLNLILLVIWAFNKETNPSKANFAKAYLIIMLVFFTLSILFFMLFGAGIWAYLQSQAEGLMPEY